MECDVHAPALTDNAWVLLSRRAVESLAVPNAAGVLERRSGLSGLSGWHAHWFSLSGSVLRYFYILPTSGRRGPLCGTIPLFRHRLRVLGTSKRVREFEIVDTDGRTHALRARTDAELHGWVSALAGARNKIPPAKPLTAGGTLTVETQRLPVIPHTAVGAHLKVDHLLCVVHGIGASQKILSGNVRQLLEGYGVIMGEIFPDVDFRAEMLVVQWRESLMQLDVHKKLQSVVPISSFGGDINPLRDFMVHRIVDYVYYTHERYRRHIMREVVRQINEQVAQFKERHPDFDGRISIYAHSLGAALVYDLLCRKVKDDQALLEAEELRINFDIDNLFLVGSPLATFLHLDPGLGLGADIRKLPFRLFNIFHPNDPLATRLEPILDQEMTGVPPILVPYWCTMGRCESTAKWLGTLWPGSSASSTPQQGKESSSKDQTDSKNYGEVRTNVVVQASPASIVVANPSLSRTPSTVENAPGSSGVSSPEYNSSGGEGAIDENTAEKAGELLRERSYLAAAAQGKVLESMCGTRRVDFGLQITSTMEEVSTSYSALRAHTEYWSNRDCMLLVVSAMMKSSYGIKDEAENVTLVDGSLIDAEQLGHHVIDKEFSRRELQALHKASCGTVVATGLEETLEDVVRNCVAKLVDDVAASTALTTQHPHVRLAGTGGVTSSGDSRTGNGSVSTGADGNGNGVNEGTMAQSSQSSQSSSSWAAYLPWFKDKGGVTQNGGMQQSRFRLAVQNVQNK